MAKVKILPSIGSSLMALTQSINFGLILMDYL